jgi:hypothetical protein
MIDPSNKDDLDALLGGGRLRGPPRDRIFEHVAVEVAREVKPRPRRLIWAFATIAASAAAVVLLAARLETRTADDLRAKGDQRPVAVQLDVACVGGTLGACPPGATLMFGASGASSSGVLSAYAEPIDRGLERIWYFSAEGESPQLTVGGAADVARRAVRIGPEHAPGRYRLHVFLTRAPAPRAVLLAGGPRDAIASRELDLRVSPPGTAPGGGAAPTP